MKTVKERETRMEENLGFIKTCSVESKHFLSFSVGRSGNMVFDFGLRATAIGNITACFRTSHFDFEFFFFQKKKHYCSNAEFLRLQTKPVKNTLIAYLLKKGRLLILD